MVLIFFLILYRASENSGPVLATPNSSGKKLVVIVNAGNCNSTFSITPFPWTFTPHATNTLYFAVELVARFNLWTSCYEMKLCVVPLSINTTTNSPAIILRSFIVHGEVKPTTEFINTSAIITSTHPLQPLAQKVHPTTPLAWTTNTVSWACWQGWLECNFSSHLKHNPSIFHLLTSAGVSLRKSGFSLPWFNGTLASFPVLKVVDAIWFLGFACDWIWVWPMLLGRPTIVGFRYWALENVLQLWFPPLTIPPPVSLFVSYHADSEDRTS